ncbi:MAG: MTH938/NDUFAF3 family protein [Candidatus Paceibacterales bacterium]
MIEEYKFGSITINGKTYNHDVEVRWVGDVLKWWRRESHVIDVGDVKRAVEQGPDTIVIGTGEMGMAKITQECQNFITQKSIKLIIDKTEEAVKTFNIILEESKKEEGKQEKVIGLFHLTC